MPSNILPMIETVIKNVLLSIYLIIIIIINRKEENAYKTMPIMQLAFFIPFLCIILAKIKELINTPIG